MKTVVLAPNCKVEQAGPQWVVYKTVDRTHHRAKNLTTEERWGIIGYCVSRVGLINVLEDNSIVLSKEGREFVADFKPELA